MSIHDHPKMIRKDTAAYASLSFFTCQRANVSPRRQKTTSNRPSALAGQPALEASGQNHRSGPAVDEAVLPNPPPPVNTIRKEFSKSRRSFSAPLKRGQSNPVHRKRIHACVAQYRTAKPLDGCSDCRQRSPSNRPNCFRPSGLMHQPDQQSRSGPHTPRARPGLSAKTAAPVVSGK